MGGALGEWLGRRLGVDRNNALLLLSNFLWGIGAGLYTAIWPVHVERLGAGPVQIGFSPVEAEPASTAPSGGCDGQTIQRTPAHVCPSSSGVVPLLPPLFSLSVTTAVSVVVYVPAAGLAGRLGRKRTMLLGWLMGPTSAAVFAVARTWEELLPGIVLLALVGLSAPAYLGYIATAAKGRDMPRLYALMTAAVSGAAVLSSPLGGRLAEAAPMPWLFAGVGVAYGLSALVVAAVQDFETADGRSRARTRRAPPHDDDGNGGGKGHPARGGRRALSGYSALLSNRSLVVLLGAQLALVGSANLSQPLAANWLVLAYGYTLSDIGLLGAAAAAGAVVWGVVLGRLASRGGASAALIVGASLVAGSAVVLLGAAPLAVGALAYILRGAFAPLRSLASGMVADVVSPPPAARPDGAHPLREIEMAAGETGQLERAFALYQTLLNITLTVSTVLAGVLYGVHPAIPFVVSAAGVLAVPAVMWGAAPMARTRRRVWRWR